jgi:hypothetical protein
VTEVRRDILLDEGGSTFTVAADSQWFSDPIDSNGVDEVIVTVATDNTANFAVYVQQIPTAGSVADVSAIPAVEIPYPTGYSNFYVAKATLQLDAATFTVTIFNTDATVEATFGASVRVVSRSVY